MTYTIGGDTSDQYLFDAIIKPFSHSDLFSGDSLLGNVVLYWRYCRRVISCHYFVYQKLF